MASCERRGWANQVQQVDRGFYTNVKGLQLEGDVVADFSDLRKLQILTDKLRRLVHILRLNIRIGRQIKKEMSRINVASSPALHTSFDGFQAKLEKFLLEQETSADRVETLIARSSGTGQLVSHPPSLGHSSSNRKYA